MSYKVNKIIGANPFVNSKGELRNKNLPYQQLLDSPKVNQRIKNYITQATGLTSRITENKGPIVTPTLSSTVRAVTGTTNVQQSQAPQQNSGGLVNTAKKYLGTPYVWGGTTPKGFDCSGLVQYVYKQNGKNIPRTSQEQFKGGTAVSQGNLQAGDLVFFKGSDGSANAPGHVGMYIGNGQYIQAPKTGDVVKISDLSGRKDYVGARRY